MLSISSKDSFAQGFHGRFGRPRDVFFFATPSMQPEAATGRDKRSGAGNRLEFPKLEVPVDAAGLCSRGVGLSISFDDFAAFRLRLR